MCSELAARQTPAVSTRWANYLDLCGLSLPNGFTKSGLPLSLQIVGKPFQEATVFQVADAFEKSTAFRGKRPAMIAA